MKNIKYMVYRDGDYYISQCLNVEVSSFGNSVDEAIDNLIEAVELYMEDNNDVNYRTVDRVLLGESLINA